MFRKGERRIFEINVSVIKSFDDENEGGHLCEEQLNEKSTGAKSPARRTPVDSSWIHPTYSQYTPSYEKT